MAKEIAILGAGMHPWGKWGHNFIEYGVAAAREALADAGVPWKDVRFVSGGAEVGAHLTNHPGVEEIHMTGSENTFNAIVFGTRRLRVADMASVGLRLNFISIVVVTAMVYVIMALFF